MIDFIQHRGLEQKPIKKNTEKVDVNYGPMLTKINGNLKRYNHPILSGTQIEKKWKWDCDSKSECVSLTKNNNNAYFFDNPYTISRGTAGVRGDKPVECGISYFEVLIKEPLYGTAIMIGYGTKDTKLHYDNFDYINLVGKDFNSWGLCHKGTVWHNGNYKKFCEPILEKDSLIGVFFNSHNKTIHYFLNGYYLGLAFTNVNPENKKLYPMVSSTATDIEVEIVNSYQIIYSLQDLCCQAIHQKIDKYDELPLPKRLIHYLKSY